MTIFDLTWKTDKNGDHLWRGEEFLGCIYNRDLHHLHNGEWRVLIGEDMKFVADVGPTPELSARMHARLVLEQECSTIARLPSAQDLLTRTEHPVRKAEDVQHLPWKI